MDTGKRLNCPVWTSSKYEKWKEVISNIVYWDAGLGDSQVTHYCMLLSLLSATV